MSGTNAEVSRTRVREVLGSTWLAETVGDPFGFDDVSMFRTPSEQDGRYAQPNPCPSRRADRLIDWDENFSDAIAPLLVRLHRLARRILHSDDLAEDAVQEAILSLWESGPATPEPLSLA